MIPKLVRLLVQLAIFLIPWLSADYRRRIKQSDELNEFAITESLRNIIVQEQDHLIALATALGIDPPDPGIAD